MTRRGAEDSVPRARDREPPRERTRHSALPGIGPYYPPPPPPAAAAAAAPAYRSRETTARVSSAFYTVVASKSSALADNNTRTRRRRDPGGPRRRRPISSPPPPPPPPPLLFLVTAARTRCGNTPAQKRAAPPPKRTDGRMDGRPSRDVQWRSKKTGLEGSRFPRIHGLQRTLSFLSRSLSRRLRFSPLRRARVQALTPLARSSLRYVRAPSLGRSHHLAPSRSLSPLRGRARHALVG